NSLDAMPDGGEIHVHTSSNGKPGIAVDFIDTGVGMTPEVMSHIFDPLYTTKDRGHGTGLGLVIVSQIVSEHGGGVEVYSEVRKGTRFRLTFAAIPNDVPVVVENYEPELHEVGS